MADQVQIPESGGGEGAAPISPAVTPVLPSAEAKSEAPVEPPKVEAQAVKTEETKEVKPEEQKEVKPEEPKETNTETPKEVETETPKNVIPDVSADIKTEQPAEVIPEQSIEVKQEANALNQENVKVSEEANQIAAEVKAEANGVAENVTASKDQGDWQQRETELLKKIEELEKVKKERTHESLLLELKVREEEIDLLKSRVKNLETELQAALSKPSGKNHEMIENIKQQHEELLSKARGMIFDKTKMVKNQELQIEALTTQIQSLKDINQITKDLLEIRNSEIKAMEDRLQAMEARFKAEKERYGLVLQRAQTSSNINDDLRKEYETQLVLFKELREKYDQRVQALVAENERLKGSKNTANGGAGTSG